MARSFNGSSDKLSRSSVVSSQTGNVTLGGWFKFSSFSANQGLIVNGYDGGGGGTGYWLRAETSGKIRFLFGFVADILGNTVLSTGIWYHILGIRSGGTAKIYINGVDEGVSMLNTPNAPASYFRVGCRIANGGAESEFLSGSAAEVGVWDGALSTDEIASLGKGFSPLFFNHNKRFYAPIIGRNSPEPDLINALDLTVTGTSQAEHPRIIYPTKAQILRLTTNAGQGNQNLALLGIG